MGEPQERNPMADATELAARIQLSLNSYGDTLAQLRRHCYQGEQEIDRLRAELAAERAGRDGRDRKQRAAALRDAADEWGSTFDRRAWLRNRADRIEADDASQ